MKISAVPRDRVDDVWHVVGPILQRAIEINRGTHDIGDIKTELLADRCGLWVAYDEGEIYAACTTRIVITPQNKMLMIDWLGGERMDDWLDDALDVIESYAHDLGCERVEIIGRKGWKVLRKYGWHDTAVVYQKELGA